MKIARKLVFTLGVLLCGSIFSESFAQCAMCRSQVESSIEGQGKVVGRGLNDGILYLMTIPYLVLGGFGYMVYRNWKGGQQKTS
jgi:hypothetical protein